MTEEVPPGLCLCGCGGATPIADRSWAKHGWVRGQPLRYIRGHRHRNTSDPYVIDARTGCWEWQWFRDRNGYGKRALKQPGGGWKWFYAHRLMYAERFGPIPAGKVLDHLCKNSGCVNPDHLEVVTQRENVYRGSGTRLSDSQILVAYGRVKAGEGLRAVARSMQTTHATLARRFAAIDALRADGPDYPQS